MDETKICKKCGRILPIQNFRLATGQFGNPYYRGSCKECEAKYDKEYKKKYVANMSFAGKNIKLGAYETVEAAFLRYKEYKEDFIKDIAEQHKDKIPNKIYQAMMNWQIEITD